MRTLNYLTIVMCSGLAVGCATVPKELVDARQSYAQASAGQAAQLAPNELNDAQEALEEAEKAFSSKPKAHRTKDLAYVAQRKAQLAEVRANTVATGKKTKQAGKEYKATQAEIINKTKAELSKAKQDANSLLLELAKLAAVREEARGLVITLSGSVLFASGQSMLLPSARSRLNQVAEALMESSGRKLTVEGHTDSKGSAQYNYGLSQRRADAVRSYLVSRGYPTDLIEAHGIGEDRPVADNASAEGRANNRRVEIVVAPEANY
jgi:outer membrane protein OmpA-like peptidoglycan-associated protein